VLARQLAEQERQNDHREAAERFDDQARVADQYSEIIQKTLLRGTDPLASPAYDQAGGRAPCSRC
jgi:hypothetical protein